ncbi:MAG: acylneuraminate cytidylyltransferase [Thaumarchaeota archaeon]|jgi:spore coat polysaccharide biosynthesis protein SpsF|nr:MAG: acylneuraminate cytidylyltransferase [Nitrososphaerota archaeon]
MTIDVSIITVRNSSKRLPNKTIMKIFNDLRAIDILIKRVQKVGLPVIIATSTASDDDIFEEIAKNHNVKIFRGSLLNKIKRWYDCFKFFNIQNALLVDGDDLAYDYEIGKRAMSDLKKSNVEMILNPPNIICGFFTYALNQDGLSKLYNVAKSEELDTDVIHKFIQLAHLKTSFIKLKNNEYDKKIRLTLDYPEDLEFFRKLYQNISVTANGNDIVTFLENNALIKEINFHKQKDFLNNQKEFNENIK